MTDFERRVQVNDLELRADEDGKRTLRGHAAVFDQLSGDLGGFRERIERGAFSETLQGEPDIRALFNHDSGAVLGRTTNGTLRLSEDDVGLRVEIDPPDTQAGRDAMASIERGDINQMSFAFRVKAGGQEFMEQDNEVVRSLSDVELFEVSPVTFPAYPDTSIAMRDLRNARQERRVSSVDLVRARLKDEQAKRKESKSGSGFSRAVGNPSRDG